MDSKLEHTTTVGDAIAARVAVSRLTQERVSLRFARKTVELHRAIEPVCEEFAGQRLTLLAKGASRMEDGTPRWQFDSAEARGVFDRAVAKLLAAPSPVESSLTVADFEAEESLRISGADLEALAPFVAGLR